MKKGDADTHQYSQVHWWARCKQALLLQVNTSETPPLLVWSSSHLEARVVFPWKHAAKTSRTFKMHLVSIRNKALEMQHEVSVHRKLLQEMYELFTHKSTQSTQNT